MPAHNFQNAQLWSCQSTKYFHTVLRIIKMFSCKTETSLHVFILKLCPSALNALFLIVEPCLLNGASQACSSLLSSLFWPLWWNCALGVNFWSALLRMFDTVLCFWRLMPSYDGVLNLLKELFEPLRRLINLNYYVPQLFLNFSVL